MIQLSWPDSRIKYMNLRDDTLDNQLAEAEVNKIWRPTTNFPNIKDGELKLLGENVYVLKVKKSLLADFNAVNMDEIYGGDAALIVQQQHYSGSFVCTFDVFYYPFDDQQCSILVQFSSVSKELVAFTTNGSSTAYSQSSQLPIYTVSDFFASVPSNDTRLSMVQVGFKLTRRYTLIVLSIYLPSLMLLAIGYTTLYVELQLLEVRLQVALTTLLVLYTFFSQTSSSLPQTAYVKQIDMWFFFCTIFLFIIIVIHVFVDKLDNNKVVAISTESSSRSFLKAPLGIPAKVKNLVSSGDRFLVTVRSIVGPIVLLISASPTSG
ncbi:glycine receptor subunit alpha-4-like [Macrobrachium nipponense]|uniref:glycine receptor subunit alpha-4-like n=1 Tax=Macrobrachium nipponense TaxID=159736 RepID=UPI0030C86FB2